jgi:hypothetical protein
MDEKKVKHEKEKQTVNYIIASLYIIPFFCFLFIQIIWIYYLSIFQTGLLIIYGVLTGLFINITFGIDFPDYLSPKIKMKNSLKIILKNRINIITISFISIIFIGVYAYNLSNILIFGCPTIGSPDGIKDIELLNYDENVYYLHEINDDHNHHSRNDHHHGGDEEPVEKEKRFIPNSNVHNFKLNRLCKDENVLFFIIIFFLFYIILLNIVTVISYGKNITSWNPKYNKKYNHFIFLILHFIPFCFVLFFQIILVYRVSVIQSGLLIPFGLITGILVSVMRNKEDNSIFKITGKDRILIILFSLLSTLFTSLYLFNLSKLYSECVNYIIPSPPSTNKMFTDFMVVELCEKEFAITITILIFISYLLVLNFVTVIIYTFYFKINHLKSWFLFLCFFLFLQSYH